jgi:ATP-binding cassette subfamily B protein
MLGRGIDTVLSSGSRVYVVVAGAVIVGASALRGLAGYGQQYVTQVVSQKVSYDIRNSLYDHLQKLSFAYHDKAQTGQLMSRATVDIEAVRMFLAMGLLSVIQTVLLVAGITYLLLTTNWMLALMTLAFVPFIAWVTIIPTV